MILAADRFREISAVFPPKVFEFSFDFAQKPKGVSLTASCARGCSTVISVAAEGAWRLWDEGADLEGSRWSLGWYWVGIGMGLEWE